MNIFEQGLLRYLKPEQLQTIQSKKIGIGGAGGLGSNCAMMLVRSGFKHLEIIDQDVIDPSNLNRQQYFANEVGLSKVEVTKKRLLDINPDAHIIIHQTQWNESNAGQFFKGFDFIVEGFDVTDWKHRFVQYYAPRFPVVISGIGMAGLLEKQPMIVKKVGNVYICGDRSTDTRQGHPPMAPRVTQCAAMMAEIVLDLTLGLTNPSTPFRMVSE
ncbi:MAG: sulfur carrier protein ThiS adenylyltransferase ThiF [Candidatus Omnitrophica bacterium]|nr:sulfur carrier protein ThiS adenylyltransferase ThiF [Candidatus Omnitrophota bacterium]